MYIMIKVIDKSFVKELMTCGIVNKLKNDFVSCCLYLKRYCDIIIFSNDRPLDSDYDLKIMVSDYKTTVEYSEKFKKILDNYFKK